MFVPNNTAEGYVTNSALASNLCIDIPRTLQIGFYHCHYTGGPQFIEYSVNSELRRDDFCFDYSKELRMFRCHGKKGTQEWNYNTTTSQFFHKKSQMCLSTEVTKKSIIVEICDEKKANQKWKFQYLYEEKIQFF
jgi:polypeptide N-acetylgalactosaminyltransferase